MDKDEVPQDTVETYLGLKRLVYAVDEQGHYVGVQSSGWEVESFSTQLAVSEMERQRDEAWARAAAGKASPLEYHMYRNRMDFMTVITVTGMWPWRVKRHFKPKVYAKLPDRVLQRYADAMGVTVQELRQLPDRSAP